MEVMYTTLQIRDSVWNHAMAYANSKGQQLTTIVEGYLMSLSVENSSPKEVSDMYDISPRIKALETGFKCPDDMSDDYKKELLDVKCSRYR